MDLIVLRTSKSIIYKNQNWNHHINSCCSVLKPATKISSMLALVVLSELDLLLWRLEICHFLLTIRRIWWNILFTNEFHPLTNDGMVLNKANKN